MRHIMIDLETLATTADAVIVSLGAVKFDQKKIDDNAFYTPISLESNLLAGRKISESTLAWWMKQSDDARKVFGEANVPLESALDELKDWIGRGEYNIWSNGASFDIPILEHAYAQFGVEPPWKFWNSRCYRTLKSMAKARTVTFEAPKLAHNALSDAYAQAQHLQLIWNTHAELCF